MMPKKRQRKKYRRRAAKAIWDRGKPAARNQAGGRDHERDQDMGQGRDHERDQGRERARDQGGRQAISGKPARNQAGACGEGDHEPCGGRRAGCGGAESAGAGCGAAARDSQSFGYVRVSTKEQNEDRQMLAMLEHGVRAANIFMDKQSGKDFDRPSYKRLVERLAPGDTLFVKSIDRLGRSYSDIIEQWRMITNGIKASIVVIDMPLLDTRQKEKDLTGALIADLVLQILSYVAQTEREFNHRRQAEGIAAARLKGRRFGRPPARPPQRFPEMLAAWRNKEISARRAARELGVSNKTFASWAMRAGE